MRDWDCIINNRKRFVVFIQSKYLNRRIHYYSNCQTTFNPTVLSSYLLMCGDIHPNPGPTMSNTNSTSSDNLGSRKQNSEQKHSSLFCMYMNARSLNKTFLTQENRHISNLIKFQELVYSESIDVMFVTETWLNNNNNNLICCAQVPLKYAHMRITII
jgi:hypothetical protein